LIDVPELDEEEEEVTGWDDLDADDIDDPAMVSEYVVDIFKYLSDCEVSMVLCILQSAQKYGAGSNAS